MVLNGFSTIKSVSCTSAGFYMEPSIPCFINFQYQIREQEHVSSQRSHSRITGACPEAGDWGQILPFLVGNHWVVLSQQYNYCCRRCQCYLCVNLVFIKKVVKRSQNTQLALLFSSKVDIQNEHQPKKDTLQVPCITFVSLK